MRWTVPRSPYCTESLDLASWLSAKGFLVLRMERLSNKRHAWVFDDPLGQAEGVAVEYVNSEVADVLDHRKRMITLARSGDINLLGKKG